LDLLPPVTGRTPAEVRERLGRVREQLQRQAADAAADASTITLRADAMRLSKIIAAFERQSGNAIIDGRERLGQPESDPLLKVGFDKTPFWAALDELLDQAGLSVYPYSERPAIEIVAETENRRARHGRACYSGPFRIEPTEIVARRGLRRSNDQSLAVAVEVAWEPRVRVIQLVSRLSDVTATDDRRQPLAVADAAARLEAAGADRSTAAKFELPFRLPSREVRQIARLRGKLTATIAGNVETFRFQNLADAKNVAQRIAGVTVTLEGVQKTEQGFEVRILVRFDDAGDALASHRTWIFDNPAYLESVRKVSPLPLGEGQGVRAKPRDAMGAGRPHPNPLPKGEGTINDDSSDSLPDGPGGKPIRYASYDTTAQSTNAVGLAYRFTTALPLDQLRFVYKTPGAIINRGYDYELKGIELP
jgi:hypothetical protein